MRHKPLIYTIRSLKSPSSIHGASKIFLPQCCANLKNNYCYINKYAALEFFIAPCLES